MLPACSLLDGFRMMGARLGVRPRLLLLGLCAINEQLKKKCLYSQGHSCPFSTDLQSCVEYLSGLVLCLWNKGNFQ